MNHSGELTLLREVAGVRIYIRAADGRFVANLGGSNWIERKDLASIVREITSRASGEVKLLEIGRFGDQSSSVRAVVRVEGDRYRCKDGGLTNGTYGYFRFDQSVADDLAQIAQEQKEAMDAFYQRREAVKDRLVQITRDEVIAELAAQKKADNGRDG